MRMTATVLSAVVALLLATLAAPAAAQRGRDLGRDVLPPRDGWAAANGGTTGGAAADAEHVFTVSTWEEFRAALGGDDARGDTTPRIIYVDGMIDAHTAADGTPLTCDDFADPEFDFDAYLETYDPETWGMEEEPFGPLEDARDRSQDNQAEQIRQYVGSNVTIVGLGDDAGFTHANLVVRDSSNVIIRNLHLSNAYDCFPQWDPTDGDSGNWNSEYDNLWLAMSTNVWVDHNTFDDGEDPPSSLPIIFGRPFEVHDGLLDITNGADFVTVSYNRFEDHDKVMLIGSTNNPTLDRGKLRVTVHHNLFADMGQRTPRVRFGQVHVYNNYYLEPDPELYQYSWGVGVESMIYAQNNAFVLGNGVEPADVIVDWGGTTIHEEGSIVNGRSRRHVVDLLAAYNAEHDPDLSPDVGWTPTLYRVLHPTSAVPIIVERRAGAGVIG